MSPTFDSLSAQALSLPTEQRIELAQRLWQSLGAPVDDEEELFAEIERRDAEVDAGKVAPIPFDQAMREIRDLLK
jgi:putative addiction module component (TIGR02574 family)